MNDRSRSTSAEWDSAVYHRVSEPQYEWGRKVLARAPLRSNDVVMDAGCGTGRLTGELATLLPSGRVVALDLSENMLRTAHEHLYPKFGERVQFVKADLQYLPFEQVFDGIFSTATFHWVPDHDRLFCRLHKALRPGGWLCAQCGGGPNLARVLARAAQLAASQPYRLYFNGFEKTWVFADAQTTTERLLQSGFVDVETGLEEAPTVLGSSGEYRQFVASVILRSMLERMPDQPMRDAFLDEF